VLLSGFEERLGFSRERNEVYPRDITTTRKCTRLALNDEMEQSQGQPSVLINSYMQLAAFQTVEKKGFSAQKLFLPTFVFSRPCPCTRAAFPQDFCGGHESMNLGTPMELVNPRKEW